jgi:hypothetical protein
METGPKLLKKMEGFSFLTPVTGLNRPNTGKVMMIMMMTASTQILTFQQP